MIGSSARFLEALDQLRRFAPAKVPLLIAGETGTGKELFARAAHYLSARADGPFVPVNCGAFPERLFENELFGHGRGAYTDARDAQRGLVAIAEGGTLLLDEIECLDVHSQAALLRFLQDQQYRPLGAGKPVQADVRVIASSNTPLARRVRDGLFRGDLLFRLDVARIELPPLRERVDDIVALARSFLKRLAPAHGMAAPRIALSLAAAMRRYHWPGNVRELENAMHRALLLSGGVDTITDLPWLTLPDARSLCEGGEANGHETLKAERASLNAAFERSYLSRVLEQTKGNIAAAARAAGTERRHLGRMIRRHGIDVGVYRR